MNLKERSVIVIILFFSICSLSFWGGDNKAKKIELSYYKMLQRAFKRNADGRKIPLAFEKAAELGGDISRDEKYFYYASNRELGNFDIYLRALNGNVVARVTSHAAKDFSPAVSPDGKRLVFVSQREDPEGDLYVVKIKPEKIIKEVKSGLGEYKGIDKEAKNITQQSSASGMVKVVKDADPAWSPDSEKIVYSSTSNGMENIWICNRDGRQKIQLTKKGGMYPRFSADGKKIIYISYRDPGRKGELYILDLNTRQEARITDSKGIKLYPTFLEDNNKCVYTLIDKDTNKDGKIDLKDSSVLYYYNIKIKKGYRLTSYKESSFAARWLPVFKLTYFNSTKVNFNGVLVYSEQIKDNININMIPEYGIIPKRKNAENQYKLYEKFENEGAGFDRALLALERVYNFYGDKNDFISEVYTGRAIKQAAFLAIKSKDFNNTKKYIKFLDNYKARKNDYRNLVALYLKHRLTGKDIDNVIVPDKFKERKDYSKIAPYLLEDLGDHYYLKKKYNRAVSIYQKISDKYPKFKRRQYINYKTGDILYRSLSADIPSAWLEVLKKGRDFQKEDIINKIIKLFLSERNRQKQKAVIKNLAIKYRQKSEKKDRVAKAVYAATLYINGYLDFMDNDFFNSKENLRKALKLLKRTQLLYYKSNVLLAQIAVKEKKTDTRFQYINNAVTNYRVKYQQADFISNVRELVGYYETKGDAFASTGQYKKAEALYEKYVNLMESLHFLRNYEDIYSEFGDRAHVLYINTFLQARKDKESAYKKLETEYLGKNNSWLDVRVMEFDKAHLYGVGYLYFKYAFKNKELKPDLLYKSVNQLEWSLFMDDQFIAPYLLKGWICQYIDLERSEKDKVQLYEKLFPAYLLEKNKDLYLKGLAANDERIFPEKEGNLHLNLANNYFLLVNYPKALKNYKKAETYKRQFASKKEEAFFYFHYGYCFWQEGDTDAARVQLNKALQIYKRLYQDKVTRANYQQYYLLKRYFALFDRMDGNYNQAIEGYKFLLEMVSRYKINEDKARLYQEIAYCYEKLGSYDKALQYLNRADKILRKKKYQEKEYNLQVKIFGVGPLGIYNMGEDVAVIGESKIFTRLDVLKKRLLNYSMQEDISYKSGNYRKTIKYLKKKLQIIEGRNNSVDKEMRILILNNIGHAYYRSGRYKQADAFFNKAWKYAGSEDVNNLNGVFISIKNKIDLYSYLLENRIDYFTDPLKAVGDLRLKINNYRLQYEKDEFKNRLAAKREDAKKLDKQVSEEEVMELRKAVQEDAARIYFAIDLSSAVLDYYQAELIITGNKLIKSSEAVPYNYYKENKKIYDLYIGAATKFENALADQSQKISIRKKIKLLLNAAICRQKTYFFRQAYEYLGEAEELARKYQYSDILFSVYFFQARFFRDNGRKIAGSSVFLAGKYFNNALKLVIEFPGLYTNQAERVIDMCDQYVRYLVRINKTQKAFSILNKRHQLERIYAILKISPDFQKEKDRALYNEYIKLSNSLRNLNDKKSFLLEKEVSSSDQKWKIIKRKEKSLLSKINDLKLRTEKSGFLYNLLFIENNLIKDKHASFIEIIGDKDRLYCWKYHKGRINFKKIRVNQRKEKSALINEYLNSNLSANSKNYIIFNLFWKDLKISRLNQNFMFINCINDVKYLPKTKTAVYNKEALAGNLTNNFSVIVDNKNDLLAEQLFSGQYSPDLVIKKITTDENISLLFDAALYNGITGLILFKGQEDIQIRNGKPVLPVHKNFADLNNLPGNNYFAFGRNDSFLKNPEEIKKITKTSFNRFEEALNKGQSKIAEYYLKKWISLTDNNLENKALNNYYLSRIFELKADLAKAYFLLNKINLNEIREKEKQLEVISYKIYLNLKMGDTENAALLLKQNPDLKKGKDYFYYQAVLNSLLSLKEVSWKQLSFPGEKFYFNRLSIDRLFSRYLILTMDSTVLKSLPEFISHTNSRAGDAEKLFVTVILNHNPGNQYESSRAKYVDKLIKSASNIKEEVLLNAEHDGNYDFSSLYILWAGFNNLMKQRMYSDIKEILNSQDLRLLSKQAYNIDSLILLHKIKEFSKKTGDRDLYYKSLNILINKCSLKKFPFLRKKYLLERAEILVRNNSHKRAYNELNKLNKVITFTDPFCIATALYDRFYLLKIENLVFLQRINEAELLIKDLKYNKKFSSYLNLLKAHLVRYKILQAQREYDKTKSRSQKNNLKKKIHLYIQNYKKNMEQVFNYLTYYKKIDFTFFRLNLFNQGVDFLITYYMANRDYAKGLYYFEVKRQINLWQGNNFKDISKKFSQVNSERFLSLTDPGKDSGKFWKIMQNKPEIYFANKIPMLALASIQKKLPEKSKIFVFSKNEQDLFVWIISNEYINSFRIKNGYKEIIQIMNEYINKRDLLKNTAIISKRLGNLFRRLNRYLRETELIYIVHDKALENIPYEIINIKRNKEENLLVRSHQVVYIPSLVMPLEKSFLKEKKSSLVIDVWSTIKKEIDIVLVAIKESGIAFRQKSVLKQKGKKAPFFHIEKSLIFDIIKKKYFVDNYNYDYIVKDRKYLVFFDPEGDNIINGDTILISMLRGVKGIVLNKTGFNGLNNIEFINKYYFELNKEGKVVKAFQKGISYLLNSKKFRHPVYWEGQRLYLNGFAKGQ